MRLALLLLAGMTALGAPTIAARAQAAPPAMQIASDPYAAFIVEAAQRFGIPATWIRAVMRIESGGDRRALSPKGAVGLMQLMPETWGALRVRYGFGHDPFDPHDNVLAGAAFLRELRDRYGSPGFLAAYNAGPGRYEDYRDRRRPLPAETIAYVAALVPFVGGGGIDGPVLVAASYPPPWMQAPLFIARPASVEPADRATPKPASNGVPAVVTVHDLSAIAPQSAGLFVVVSAARSKP